MFEPEVDGRRMGEVFPFHTLNLTAKNAAVQFAHAEIVRSALKAPVDHVEVWVTCGEPGRKLRCGA